MSQPPSHPQQPPGSPQQGSQGPGTMPNGRPRPGASSQTGTSGAQPPSFQSYELPRLYDTSVRPAGGLTAARHAPAALAVPTEAQPQSAWGTQTRRVQDIQSVGTEFVPASRMLMWILAALLGVALLVVLAFFFVYYALQTTSSPLWWLGYLVIAGISLFVVAGVIFLADRWDPQPIPLLLSAIFWGAAIAVAISFVLNTLFSAIVYSMTGDPAITNVLGAVISAPLVEETTKGLGLVVLFLLARRYFNGPLDGLIYGALIGGGFAFTENILYYGNALDGGGIGGLFVNSIVRGMFGIFGHAIYTSLTGVIMGLVARKWGTFPGALVFLVATWPGMFLHALWNLSASVGPSGLGFLVIMMVFQMCLAFVWLVLMGILVWDESRLTRVRLGDYANSGWLTHEEVAMLATWKGRRSGRQWASSIGAKPVMKKFIRDSADLATVRQRLMADGAHPKAVADERALLNKLTENRRSLLRANGAG